MNVDTLPGGRSAVTLDRYEDLLTVRALADYRFTGGTTVEVDTHALAELGIGVTDAEKPMLPLPEHPFDYQAWVIERAFQRERFAAFMLTGLGKTIVQVEWARQVAAHTGGQVLIVAPLNVCAQTIAEAERFYGTGPVDATERATLDAWLVDGTDVAITNYEKLDGATEPMSVAGVVLDESSMLRSLGGSRKWGVVHSFAGVRFKLCCSATPAPNDRTEYAQHAVFLDQVRSTKEYLTAYFRNDGKGNWDFKTHAYDAWVSNLASWAVFMHDPARWRFDALPDMPELVELFPPVELTAEQRARARGWESGSQPSLLGATPGGVTSRVKMQQISNGFELVDGKAEWFASEKPAFVGDLVRQHPDEQVIVWVHFDAEGDHLYDLLTMAGENVEHLSGRTSMPNRTRTIEAFRRGDGPRVLILKPAMFATGLNLQACTVQIFSSVHDSFERYFQAVRRSYRFGQSKPVRVYVPLTDLDEAINANVMEKQATFIADARALEEAVVARLRPLDTSEVRVVDTAPKIEVERCGSDAWTLVLGDSVAHMETMAEHSVDHAVFSPPFPALFAYSKELGDVANVRGTAADTSEHRLVWGWFAERLLRVMAPGRIVAIHCKEIIQPANTHGFRWTYDYPSELRAGMEDAGFRYHRRITIEKNPQSEATRNKETSLLHVTVKRNALNAFPQAGEYLLVFAAPGDPEVPVPTDISFEKWCEWANGIWPDHASYAWHGIRETDVLNTAVAREHPDERHCCPLQLGLIERTVRLWSNPGELVFSPFAGIGSEGVVALEWDRRFYGIELKESYYRTAARNLAHAEDAATSRLPMDEVAS
jgi:DNA modification methylase